MSDWQPIETAPKDGTKFLATGLDYGTGPSRHTEIVFWDRRRWRSVNTAFPAFGARIPRGAKWIGDNYTTPAMVFLDHWQPLPAPPTEKEAR